MSLPAFQGSSSIPLIRRAALVRLALDNRPYAAVPVAAEPTESVQPSPIDLPAVAQDIIPHMKTIDLSKNQVACIRTVAHRNDALQDALEGTPLRNGSLGA